jgi:hypothetical protein
MIMLPGSSNWKGGLVSRRLRELGQHLAQLSRRVREAVTQAVRETVAQLARDAVDRILQRRPPGSFMPPQLRDERDEREDGKFDPWEDEEDQDPWRSPYVREDAEEVPEPPSAAQAMPDSRSALALALAAAGWWLRQRGSLWGALGVGLIAGAIAAVTRRLADNGFLLVQAAHELLAYRHAVAGFADQ